MSHRRLTFKILNISLQLCYHIAFTTELEEGKHPGTTVQKKTLTFKYTLPLCQSWVKEWVGPITEFLKVFQDVLYYDVKEGNTN